MPAPDLSPALKPVPARRFAARLAAIALLWLAFTGANPGSWLLGAPAVLAAAWLSVKLLPADTWLWRLTGALAFAYYFARESLKGGWDVAWRALKPGLNLRPGLITYSPRLPVGAARWFFCGVISLLPGTCTVAIAENRIQVHALELKPDLEAELRQLEDRVARLFGQEPEPGKERQA